MKHLILTLSTLLLTTQVQALTCEGESTDDSPGSIIGFNLEADAGISRKTGQIVLNNVTVKVHHTINEAVGSEGYETETGTGKELRSDLNYSPRVHIDAKRIDLSKLKSFHPVTGKALNVFLPSDTCQLDLIIPQDWTHMESFSAPVMIHCDQSGGRIDVECYP